MDVSLEMEEMNQPWFGDDWGTRVLQQKMVRRFIDSENDSRLEYKKNGEGAYVIVNKEKTNKWGNLRGVCPSFFVVRFHSLFWDAVRCSPRSIACPPYQFELQASECTGTLPTITIASLHLFVGPD